MFTSGQVDKNLHLTHRTASMWDSSALPLIPSNSSLCGCRVLIHYLQGVVTRLTSDVISMKFMNPETPLTCGPHQADFLNVSYLVWNDRKLRPSHRKASTLRCARASVALLKWKSALSQCHWAETSLMHGRPRPLRWKMLLLKGIIFSSICDWGHGKRGPFLLFPGK